MPHRTTNFYFRYQVANKDILDDSESLIVIILLYNNYNKMQFVQIMLKTLKNKDFDNARAQNNIKCPTKCQIFNHQ